mmetsp:Transcript_25882/g.90116  ORF Transcript_25882/g.90116 Transcript_25882/m.90116 type:complete len:206 (+) Transcript_25882:1011-1628(+)
MPRCDDLRGILAARAARATAARRTAGPGRRLMLMRLQPKQLVVSVRRSGSGRKGERRRRSRCGKPVIETMLARKEELGTPGQPVQARTRRSDVDPKKVQLTATSLLKGTLMGGQCLTPHAGAYQAIDNSPVREVGAAASAGNEGVRIVLIVAPRARAEATIAVSQVTAMVQRAAHMLPCWSVCGVPKTTVRVRVGAGQGAVGAHQ